MGTGVNERDEAASGGETGFVGAQSEVKVDAKGRMSVTVSAQQFLAQNGDNEYFLTAIFDAEDEQDLKVIRIYPMSVWLSNEKLLLEQKEFADDAADILFVAYYYGHKASIDSHGRILLPARSRKELKLENETAVLVCGKGPVVDVYTIAAHNQRLQSSRRGVYHKKRRIGRIGFV